MSFNLKMNCNVCCENVGKVWNSYGGENICQSCRVFFFRSVQNSAHKTFEKEKCESRCVIQSKNRKSCKKCRFRKCISVGMKVMYVKKNQTQLVPHIFRVLNFSRKAKKIAPFFAKMRKIAKKGSFLHYAC